METYMISPTPIALVTCVVRHADARLAPLTHITALLSELLDASALLTPVDAASRGSLRLFDRVQQRVARDPHVDGTLQGHWLALALQVALRSDDLPMAQRIHAWHPEPLFIHASVAPPMKPCHSTLALALRFGTLETVQWVVANRRDGLCCSVGVQNLCSTCVLAALPCIGDKDPFRIFQWLVDERVLPIVTQRDISKLWDFMIRSVDVVQWLHGRKLLSRPMGELVLGRAVEDGRADITRFLLVKGYRLRGEKNIERKLIRASCFGHTEVVEALLSSDQCRSIQFQRAALSGKYDKLTGWPDAWMTDRIQANETARDDIRTEASRSGNLKTLRWLYEEHGIRPSMWHLHNHCKTEVVLLQVYKWMHQKRILDGTIETMNAASRDGFLEVVRWLHASSAASCTIDALDDAAANGHLDVVEWLHLNRKEGCSRRALISAAHQGHFRVVQWLLLNRGELIPHVDEAKTQAAAGGHLELLAWLCGFGGVTCSSCLAKASLRSSQPSPYVLRWLHARDRSLCRQCADAAGHVSLQTSSSEAAIHAAVRGDLDLLKFLDELFPSECSALWIPATPRHVRQNGHVAVRQWIVEKLRGSGDEPNGSAERVDEAAWRDAQRDARMCGDSEDSSIAPAGIQRHEIR